MQKAIPVDSFRALVNRQMGLHNAHQACSCIQRAVVISVQLHSACGCIQRCIQRAVAFSVQLHSACSRIQRAVAFSVQL